MKQISIIIPTYNEAKNLPPLVEELLASVPRELADLEIIFVDDNSPDGTGQVAEELAKKWPVKVVHRAGKLGLGSAVRAGFAVSTRPIIGVMDADLSHDPSILPTLIRALDTNDIAIGSRFVQGSQVNKWIWWRKLLSEVGVRLTKYLTGVRDPLSGYFFMKRSVIEGVSLTTTGYKILFEILVKGKHKNVAEFPFQFRMRTYSSSKLNWKEHWLFLKQMAAYSWYRADKVLLVIVLAATGLLLWGVAGRTFWMDETAVLEYVRQSPWQFVWEYFKRPDNHPPLYYFLVVLLAKILPWTELTIRLVSIAAGVGIVTLVYFFTRRLWGEKKYAYLAAGATAFSSYFVLIGQMARYHSLTAFFNLLALYFFYLLVQGEWTRKNLAWFAGASIAVCLTDYPHFIYTVVITNGYLLYRLLRKKFPGRVVTWIKVQALILLSFLPMLWLLLQRIFVQGDGGFEKHNLLANSPVHLLVGTIFHVYVFFFGENILPWNYVWFGVGSVVLVAALVGIVLALKRRTFSSAHGFVLGLFFAYIILNTLFLNVFNPRYNFIVYPKYVFVAYPLFVISVVGCLRYFRSLRVRVMLVVAWALVAGFGLTNFYARQNYLNGSYFNSFAGFEFVRDHAQAGQYLLITGDANGGVYDFYREKYFSKLLSVERDGTTALPTHTRVWFFATGSDDPATTHDTDSVVPAGFKVVQRFDSVPLDPILKKYKEKILHRPSYEYKYSVFLLEKNI